MVIIKYKNKGMLTIYICQTKKKYKKCHKEFMEQ